MQTRTLSNLSGVVAGLSILVVLVAGMVIGAVIVQFTMPPVSGTSVPSHGFSTATGCADPDDSRGWVAVVPDSDHRSVYLMNYTYLHDAPEIELRSTLTEAEPNVWLLELTTMPVDSRKDVPEECQPRTTIDTSVALPTTAQSLTITLNDEQISVVSMTQRRHASRI